MEIYHPLLDALNIAWEPSSGCCRYCSGSLALFWMLSVVHGKVESHSLVDVFGYCIR